MTLLFKKKKLDFILTGWSATVLSALLARSQPLQTFTCKDFDSEPMASSAPLISPIKKPPARGGFFIGDANLAIYELKLIAILFANANDKERKLSGREKCFFQL